MFRFVTGKLRRTYDESIEAANQMQRSDSDLYRLDPIDWGRRVAAVSVQHRLPWSNVFERLQCSVGQHGFCWEADARKLLIISERGRVEWCGVSLLNEACPLHNCSVAPTSPRLRILGEGTCRRRHGAGTKCRVR